MYSSNAERQAAYRARLAERQALGVDARLAARLSELETALAAAVRRAEAAEERAERAEHQTAVARERIKVLEISLAGLQHRADIPAPPGDKPAAGMNRQARRRAEREQRRRH
jgi:hypothetical protein